MSGIQNFFISHTAGSSSSLYDFTTATFTTGGVEGRTGPSLTQARSGLSGPEINSWKNDTSFFNTSSGIQLWTVPADGNYRILTAGASGRNTAGTSYIGDGAVMRGDFPLLAGTILFILIGQRSVYTGVRPWQGGGGGTFVATGASIASSDPLIVAGGGAAIRSTLTYNNNMRASTSTSGKNGTGSSGGSGGYAASGGGHNADSSGGGAAGFYSNGNPKGDRRNPVYVSGSSFNGAQSFRNGGNGGEFDTTYDSSQGSPRSGLHGGFGGGGPGGWGGAGGGGGYSGGGNCNKSNYAGGGGSFISSSAIAAATSDGSFSGSGVTAIYSGSVSNLSMWNSNANGYCIITKL